MVKWFEVLACQARSCGSCTFDKHFRLVEALALPDAFISRLILLYFFQLFFSTKMFWV